MKQCVRQSAWSIKHGKLVAPVPQANKLWNIWSTLHVHHSQLVQRLNANFALRGRFHLLPVPSFSCALRHRINCGPLCDVFEERARMVSLTYGSSYHWRPPSLPAAKLNSFPSPQLIRLPHEMWQPGSRHTQRDDDGHRWRVSLVTFWDCFWP